ncbi:hypothetical protein ARMSODRAFT_1008096 [Armillaria solidipes]|uniref:Uncharacterized protein n=1 Tax=Armillaria solidipes TaxID=1076256 RepID=A0A2H3B6Z3_9AGAR|nr:hypothetical protein ARMSODRAFT_1008096 [Armillaria solidipes]
MNRLKQTTLGEYCGSGAGMALTSSASLKTARQRRRRRASYKGQAIIAVLVDNRRDLSNGTAEPILRGSLVKSKSIYRPPHSSISILGDGRHDYREQIAIGAMTTRRQASSTQADEGPILIFFRDWESFCVIHVAGPSGTYILSSIVSYIIVRYTMDGRQSRLARYYTLNVPSPARTLSCVRRCICLHLEGRMGDPSMFYA